ncbi:MAG: hypothetical protein QM808_14300 [Steroidobacteraceae bacterium]
MLGLVLPALFATGAAWSQAAPPPGGAPGAGPGPGQAVVPEVDHSKECDSTCLRKHMDQYLAAYLKHDPATLQVNPTLRASENSKAVALGDNSWNQVKRMLPEQVVLTDPFAGQVMALGVVEMRGPQQFIFSLRLKIENNKISESEIQTIAESIGGVHFRPDLMAASYKTLDTTIPAAERSTRAELLKAARVAWGLDSGTVSRTETCLHYENWESPDGGSGCRGAGRNPRNVRVPLVDVEKGVAVSYFMEDFSSPQLGNGPPAEANMKLPVFYLQPTSLSIAKAAKFTQGKFAMDAWLMQTGEIGMMPVFRK